MILSVILPHVFFWFSENRESDFFFLGGRIQKKLRIGAKSLICCENCKCLPGANM